MLRALAAARCSATLCTRAPLAALSTCASLAARRTLAPHVTFSNRAPHAFLSTRSSRAWTSEEDSRLRLLVAAEASSVKWSRVAAALGERDARSCRQRWEHTLRPDLARGTWTLNEIRALASLHQQHGNDYTAIAAQLPTARTSRQVRERVLEGGRRGRAWSADEDAALSIAVRELGRRWVAVAARIPGRTDSQCLERWSLSVDPKLSRGAWSEAEDARLRSAVEKLRDSKETFHFGDVASIVGTRHRKACRQRFRLLERQESKSV